MTTNYMICIQVFQDHWHSEGHEPASHSVRQRLLVELCLFVPLRSRDLCIESEKTRLPCEGRSNLGQISAALSGAETNTMAVGVSKDPENGMLQSSERLG
ncbi:hypothetical protein CERZMDRAFT_89729 [Cercospora zeae-maydis SCOH1-5]|uniref:Uncharacterized protein n=1 Tax=Cercospora zeae-maydis SCOH1-5 TaxID=717836 RepID=A0A6A6FTW8_9PEZI|nr:hypothetical protein CERZMDRAFT_89729 [Cercospora zeae-maydis SCOH1-5]